MHLGPIERGYCVEVCGYTRGAVKETAAKKLHDVIPSNDAKKEATTRVPRVESYTRPGQEQSTR
jgi:hypothetical protein